MQETVVDLEEAVEMIETYCPFRSNDGGKWPHCIKEQCQNFAECWSNQISAIESIFGINSGEASQMRIMFKNYIRKQFEEDVPSSTIPAEQTRSSTPAPNVINKPN